MIRSGEPPITSLAVAQNLLFADQAAMFVHKDCALSVLHHGLNNISRDTRLYSCKEITACSGPRCIFI